MTALQHFRDSNNGRDPEGDGDEEGLLSSRGAVAAKMGVDCSLIPENILRYVISAMHVFKQLCPAGTACVS